MVTEIDPKSIPRSMIYDLSMSSPMPMVTITKTVDITRLVRLAKRKRLKLNSLICYSILRAALDIEEFYYRPTTERLIKYDELRISTSVLMKNGAVDVAVVKYYDNFASFNAAYLEAASRVRETCLAFGTEGEYARIGTSAIVGTEIDSIVNFYCPELINPFLAWGKYRRRHLLKYTLPISFQFHHAQMDGSHVARFFNNLEAVIKKLKTI